MNSIQRARRRLLPLMHHARRQLHDLRLLIFEVTQRCNVACRHCGSDCVSHPTQPDLPLEDILRVLTEVRGRWDSKKIMVMVIGGEPLCYPDFWELGRHIRKLQYPWGLVTNGYAWSDADFRGARRAHLDSVALSLDGMEAEHDWMRGRPGSWARAVATLDRLLQDRFWQVMDVVTCVTPQNLPVLDELHGFLSGKGLPAWRLMPVSPLGRAATHPELQLDEAQFKRLMEKILDFKGRGGMKVNLSESHYLGPCLEGRVRDHYYYCQAGIHAAGIMVNGDILACPNLDRRLRQGNLATDSFVDCWENRYQLFRDRRWMKTGDCASCDQWIWCQGTSLHNWDLEKSRPKLCHYREMKLDAFPG